VKAISLWQPWASAIPLGLKRIETRGWSTNYRGPIVIHAAKRMDAQQREFIAREYQAGRLPRELPLGCLVATARIVEVLPSEILRDLISYVERIYGVYDDGRFGWVLSDIRAIEPVPYKGGQGFFNVPDELIRYAA
jgi:hypothetical protein